ncbi:MAG TPA: peptidoglycan editing factor PgeF [Vitreimonas sp.]|uniref:peptidoglycan editing factor PgeF n=1 Tax=Vitreimonas sp. TaxID=3069702 RepID=UPI002D57AF9D|nr:peptidoglycan editing factor PgeF [Vitreimonas sp.]HYD86666.1 peptidoglycan editing factor PgeF [Vitreimonas sp.]
MPVEPQPSSARGLLSADAPPHWTADALARVRHGFFGRRGGVSGGIYATLNAGTGSNDDREATRENRTRIAAAFAAPLEHLLGVHQVHSPHAVFVNGPWRGERPHADALVTTTPGLVISVLTADCAPVLLADAEAGVIGAAHAGWKGAIGGVLEAAVALMQEHGAARERIAAAIGPCIHQGSYEVGAEFEQRFRDEDGAYARYFAPGDVGHFQFDLPGFCADRLCAAGVRQVETLALDTYAREGDCFSHRRSVHRREGDYGRNCAAIAL